MQIRESGEDYLETILNLKNKNGNVRSIDIANELGFSKPSISRAVKILRENGFITVANNGFIEFTEKGHIRANQIYERHRLITEFLMVTLDISEEVADKDACRIEHIISKETFDNIKKYVENK